MSNFKRTIWFGNGYGIEFVIIDSCNIVYDVIKEKDPTLVSTDEIYIGGEVSTRNAEIDEDSGEVIPGTKESLRDFASRAHLEGIEFAKTMMAEYKESIELDAALGKELDEALETFGESDPASTKH